MAFEGPVALNPEVDGSAPSPPGREPASHPGGTGLRAPVPAGPQADRRARNWRGFWNVDTSC